MTSLKDYRVKKVERKIDRLLRLVLLPEDYVDYEVDVLHKEITEDIVNLNDMKEAFRLYNKLHNTLTA